MNNFVNEHTILMREFLRKISTLTDEDVLLAEAERVQPKLSPPVLALTPQSMGATPTIAHSHPDLTRKKTQLLTNQEMNFDLELIDFGKQLSILHSLLHSIHSTLDESTKLKFGQELIQILDELHELKKSKLNCITNPNFSVEDNLSQVSHANSHKLYSYDNRLHYALLKNNQQSSPLSPLTPNSNVNDSSAMKKSQHSSSSSSSSRYSSQLALNMAHAQNDNTNSRVSENSNSHSSQNKVRFTCLASWFRRVNLENLIIFSPYLKARKRNQFAEAKAKRNRNGA